jgi:hypothetical protein
MRALYDQGRAADHRTAHPANPAYPSDEGRLVLRLRV